MDKANCMLYVLNPKKDKQLEKIEQSQTTKSCSKNTADQMSEIAGNNRHNVKIIKLRLPKRTKRTNKLSIDPSKDITE